MRSLPRTWALGPVSAHAAAVLVLLVSPACAAKHRPHDSGVVTLVPGPASRYGSITATGPAGATELAPELRTHAVPVLAARAFARPSDVSEYGLDRPAGHLRYERTEGGAPLDLELGGATFDGRGIYVALGGDARIFLVFADAITPVLRVAGMPVPAAS